MKIKKAIMMLAVVGLCSMSVFADDAKMDTPKNTIKTFFAAAQSGNIDQAMECLKIADKQKPFVKSMLNMMAVSCQFEKAMKKAYPKADISNQITSQMKITDEMLDKANVKIVNNEATVTLAGDDNGRPMKMVKENGKWLMIMDEMPGAQTKEDYEKAAKMINVTAGVIKNTMKLIGQEGQTAETIKKALETAMMAEMIKMMQEAQKNQAR